MPVSSGTSGGRELLGLYLNDHLAGATAGRELFRRAVRTHRGTDAGTALRALCDEVEQDRASLQHIMRSLHVPVTSYKVWLGWTAEKAGRLKLNGSVLRRSPLSSVVELEAMALGVAGKAAGFRVLRTIAERDPRLDRGQLDDLVTRAEAQQQTLERLRLAAAAEVFAG